MDIFKAGVKDGLRLSEELEIAKMRIRHVKSLMEDFANLSSKNISREMIEWLEYNYGFGR